MPKPTIIAALRIILSLAIAGPAQAWPGQSSRVDCAWGGEPGDAIVTVKFERHPKFRRDGADLRVDVPITLYEAVLGGKVRVPTLDGEVELTLPANVNTSKALRLKGKGLHSNGDLYAGLRIVLPDKGDPDLESLMRFWRDQKPYKVRD